jgi:hypothetical protein
MPLGSCHAPGSRGVAPGYDEYCLWRKSRVTHDGQRKQRPIRLANAHVQLSQGQRPWVTGRAFGLLSVLHW